MKVVSGRLIVGDLILDTFADEPPISILAAFSDDEYRSYVPDDDQKKVFGWPRHHWHEMSIQESATTVGALCDRLDLAGFSRSRVEFALAGFVRYQMSCGVEYETLSQFHNIDSYAAALSTALADPTLRTAPLMDFKPNSLVLLLMIWSDYRRALWDGLIPA